MLINCQTWVALASHVPRALSLGTKLGLVMTRIARSLINPECNNAWCGVVLTNVTFVRFSVYFLGLFPGLHPAYVAV